MKKMLPVLVAALLFVSACSSRPNLKPEEEAVFNETDSLIKATKIDLDTAAKYGAKEFAREPMLAAESDLKLAENSLEFKDFSRAREFAKRANSAVKATLSVPVNAQNAINEAQNQINAAKSSGADVDSPVNYKIANDYLTVSKTAFTGKNFSESQAKARIALEAARKAVYEPFMAKKNINALEESTKLAKTLQMDTLNPELYDNSNAALLGAKAALSGKAFTKAIDGAEKANTSLNDAMRNTLQLIVQQGKNDINDAKEAGASEFASDKLAEAEEAIAVANSASIKGDFSSAKLSADKAITAAKEASNKARTGKESAAIQAEEQRKAAKATEQKKTDELALAQKKAEAKAAELKAAAQAAERKRAEAKAAEQKKAENTPQISKKPVAQAPESGKTEKPSPAIKKESTNIMDLADKKVKKIPFLPIAIGGVVIITAILLIIRSYRKRVTTATSSSNGSN